MWVPQLHEIYGEESLTFSPDAHPAQAHAEYCKLFADKSHPEAGM